MKIYHGANHKMLKTILSEGITPRGTKRDSHWDKAPSHEDMVYLTTAYPFYFSFAAGGSRIKGLVFEIDFEKLKKRRMYPDEDFLHQATKNPPALHVIREDLVLYRKHWKLSLEMLGNVCYEGVIPIDVITRYCVVDFKKHPKLGATVLDPSISIINYKIKGDFYKHLVAWFFGDEELLPQVAEMDEYEMLDFGGKIDFKGGKKIWTELSKQRDGIKVVDLKKA